MRCIQLLLCTLLILLQNPFAKQVLSSCPRCGPAITNLLSNVTFAIPSQNISSGGIILNVSSIVCGNIVVSGLDILTDPNAGSVQINLVDAGLTCSAKFQYHAAVIFSGSGTLEASAEKSSVSLLSHFMFDDEHVPISVTASKSECKSDIRFSKISFSGGILSWILSGLTNLFKPFIQSSLDSTLCTEIPKLITINGTQLLSKVGSVIHEIIQTQPTIVNPPPPSSGAVDFSQFASVLNDIVKITNSTTQSSTHPMFINSAVKYFTNGSGVVQVKSLDFEIPLGNDGLTDTNITIGDISIKGLDSFTDLELLKPVSITGYPGNYSLMFKLGVDELAVYADGNVTLGPGSMILHSQGVVVEEASITFALYDVQLMFIVQLDISEHDLTHMEFGRLLHSPVECIAQFLRGTNGTLVDISIGSVDSPRIEGFDGLDSLFNEVLGVIDELFGKILLEVVHGGFANGLTRILNVVVNDALADARHNPALCPHQPSIDAEALMSDVIDLESSKVVKILDTILDLLNVDSPIEYSINHVIDILTDNIGGVVENSELVGVKTAAADEFGLSQVDLRLFNLQMLNLNKLYDWALLRPVSSYNLNSTVAFGGPSILTDALNASIGLYLDLKGSAIENRVSQILDNLTMMVSLGNASIDIDLSVRISKWHFLQQTLSSLTDLDRGCVFSIFDSLELSKLKISIGDTGLGFDCISCSSSGFNSWSSMLDKQGALDELNSDISGLLEELSSTHTKKFLNSVFSGKIRSSRSKCYSSGTDDVSAPLKESPVAGSNMTPTIVVCSLTGAFVGIGLLWYILVKRKQDNNQVNNTEKEQQRPLLGEKSFIDDTRPSSSLRESVIEYSNEPEFRVGCHYFEAKRLPLYRNSVVSRRDRYLIPCLLIIDMGLFLVAHNTVGASVNLLSLFAGDNIRLPSLFAFSLGNSIREMWKAEVYPLALLILVFSGIWPYLKSLMMLACWFLPPSQTSPDIVEKDSHKEYKRNTFSLSPKHRERMLHWLDILGKWSLVDAYVLVLMMVAFRFHVGTPVGKQYIPDNLLLVDVIVFPGFGIHGFMIAAILQLVVTHWIIFYDRKAIELAQEQFSQFQQATGAKTAVLRSSLFHNKSSSEESEEEGNKEVNVHFTFLAKHLISFTLLLSLGLTIAGSITPSFLFQFRGAAAVVLGPAKSTHSYSLVSVADVLLQPDAGVIFLWVVFLLFALVVPSLQLLMSLGVWVWPLQRRLQKKLIFGVEILRAMSALEVFIVSVIAALYELKQFVSFIIGDKCDGINSVLRRVAGGLLPGGEDVCFDVIAELDPRCWVLLLAGILGVGTTFFVLEVCDNVVRTFEAADNDSSNVEPVIAHGSTADVIRQRDSITSPAIGDSSISMKLNSKVYRLLSTIRFIQQPTSQSI